MPKPNTITLLVCLLAAATATADLAQEQLRYAQHVTTLTDPYFEGRGTGLPGGDRAAEYVRYHFEQAGLTPLFRDEATLEPSWFQSFPAAGSTKVISSSVTLGQEPLDENDAYEVLGISASADTDNLPLVFVGYSVQDAGPEGAYNSYNDADDLRGKAALILRFEPMDETGRSLWTQDGDWSINAGLSGKILAAADRGASAIILVNTPGADDPRANKLVTSDESASWTSPLDVPAIMLDPDTLSRALTAAGEPSLEQLRDRANRQGGVTDLDLTIDINTRVDRTPAYSKNVGAVLMGKGPLADQFVVVGAHYDHLGYGYTGGSRTGDYGQLHPGADDNASGTSAMLVCARLLAERAQQTDADRRTIVFLAFGAEEIGLIGSRHFVRNAPFQADSITAMLNMDMVGRIRENRISISGVGTAEGFRDIIEPIVDRSTLKAEYSAGGRGPSDHAPFYAAGVPVLHFFSGLHLDYHAPTDTPEKINVEDAVAMADIVASLLLELATRHDKLVFTGSRNNPAHGDIGNDDAGVVQLKVQFGIMPGYAQVQPGVQVDTVLEGTSADDAGIEDGDRLVSWNGEKLRDIRHWMSFLDDHEPGDVVTVTVDRDGTELEIDVTLKPRRGGRR